ncbi:T9SS type B sorting domain-containing protein [Flavobacterium sp. 140616W15]|uniref:Ig-like domain-containing protein n=1 Tax=Flavobacterium sp. 140616W15 TaxID=2478552 RepID=UPI000F0BFBC6|nr:T9SS type B sorting domain-containing protein [Flavobacterium sp. 140616W15]AYN03014.1 gliding motility-associated C-terminal domain-containing protein [Flavobacterium sp. 140616W15]
MKRILLFLFLSFSFTIHSQCFECNKNIGNWTDDSAMDIEKTIDGIVYLIDSGGFTSSIINKYDFNCNLIWSKTFGYNNIAVKAVSSDELGNIYILIYNFESLNGGLGPFNYNGFIMSPGLNFFKLNSLGTIIWSKSIVSLNGIGHDMQNIFFHNNELYITGTFNTDIIFTSSKSFNLPYTYHSKAFIAKYDTNGNFMDAISHGNGDDIFKYSEIDNQGNIYLTRSHYNAQNSNIDKFNSSLQLNWSKILSSNTNSNAFGIYVPTGIHFNAENNKLYIWGKISLTTNILGNIYFVSSRNDEFQSVLTEFNTANGNLENIKRFDNSSSYIISSSGAVQYGRSAYMTEKNGYLYILTSFRGTMVFPNGIATSTKYYNNIHSSEDLILFKMKLSDFSSEFMFQSNGVPNLSYFVTNLPGNLFFNGDNLYLTSTFGSNPMKLNGAIINNNSGNNDPDAMLYKFNINSTTSDNGEILAENTCFNTPTNFTVRGTFDSILWDFDDPNSTVNNTSNINNPQHQFTTQGIYNISAVVKCGSESQTIQKKITITKTPINTSLNPKYACESNSGSGISNSFDTSDISTTIIGNQTNLIVEYRDSNGTLLPSPLPNPFTNTIKNEETIKVKSYFKNNPFCFVETDLKLYTTPKPIKPTITSPQTFCIQENATLNNIQITGQNIKWYHAQIGGTLLTNTTLLQDGKTYYASQTINECESERVAITIKIQDTPSPSGDANQPFCTGLNPTLDNIIVTGENIKWYNALTNGISLANNTSLQNGTTYYASQTLNNCESKRLAVTVSIQNTPAIPTGDTNQKFCKSENATLNNINIIEQNLRWYDSNLSASSLPNNTLLQNNTTYYVSQVVGCESERLAVLVNVYDTAIPNANTQQTFCIDQYATIADINITGNSIIWYDAQTMGTILANTTILENKIYYATQTINGCESERLAVNVKIQDTQPPILNGNQSFCAQQNATISDIKINGQNIKWYDSFTTGTDLSESTPLENGIIYYASQTINGCESERSSITINILEPTTTECINYVDELPFPKFFTPNNDGYNDTWTIDFRYLKPNTRIQIFNRYGKLIKELATNTSWDGTYIGQNQPSSDYWFVVTRLNGAEFKSHFSLKR